jgi:hypothetical protein
MTTPVQPAQPKALVTDSQGERVEVVERDIAQPNPKTEDVDKVLTPTSIKEKQQDAEKLERANAEVERKLNQ